MQKYKWKQLKGDNTLMDLTVKYILRYLFLKHIPSIFYKYILKIKYKRTYNRSLNLDNPERLSDKIQWMKLYTDNPRKTLLSDKIYVKNFVSKNVPELKYAQIYQIANSFNDIDFTKLPDSFVLKTNHAWRTNFFVKNKNNLDYKTIRILLKTYKIILKINYAYWSYYELHYRNIKPYIFAEEFLGNPDDIVHWEVWCFNGKAEFVSYRFPIKFSENNHIRNVQYFFNSRWEPCKFYIGFKGEDPPLLNSNKDKVIKYAQLLAKDINFVRVDFMEINNELYFGEMTFTPCSGFLKFTPDFYDFIYGKKIDIQKETKEKTDIKP